MLNRKSKPTDALIQSAATFARDDLLELKAAIDALVIATEPQPNVIDLDDARDRLRPEAPSKRSSEGWIELQYKTVNGKRYGPYRYLRWRQGTVKKSKYLGTPTNAST